MANKLITLDVLKQALNKIKGFLDKKADEEHTHDAVDITESETQKFVTGDEKASIDKIVIDGEGTKVLHDDGIYKELVNVETIDDAVASTSTTYSSSKINIELGKKANTTDLDAVIVELEKKVDTEDSHSHDNKNVLDDISLEKFSIWNEKTGKIVTTGNGDKYLADDGIYRKVAGGSGASDWSELTNKPFELIDEKSFTLESVDVLQEDGSYKTVNKLKVNYDSASGGGIPQELGFITNTGDGTKYLANDGNYYIINNFGINDIDTTGKTTYSSEKIDEKLGDLVNNLILPSQNDAPTIWQKTYLNVVSGDVLEMVTSEEFTMDKVIIQAYKFIAGDKGIVEVIKTFNNGDKDNFYYNKENVMFTDSGGGKMKIKDSYVLNSTYNPNGYYESDVIRKSDYLDNKIYGIEVM